MSHKINPIHRRAKYMQHDCPEGWVLVSKDGKCKECQTCGEVAFNDDLKEALERNYDQLREIQQLQRCQAEIRELRAQARKQELVIISQRQDIDRCAAEINELRAQLTEKNQ